MAEIVETIRKGPLRCAADRLMGLATERMNQAQAMLPCKPDDLTFMLFRQG